MRAESRQLKELLAERMMDAMARATWDWLSPCRSNRAASIRCCASNAAKRFEGRRERALIGEPD